MSDNQTIASRLDWLFLAVGLMLVLHILALVLTGLWMNQIHQETLQAISQHTSDIEHRIDLQASIIKYKLDRLVQEKD